MSFMLAAVLLATQVPVTQNALCISDIHFDPLADPSLVPQLMQAPISQWDAIFASSKKKGFSSYGSDSNYTLMMSAISAAKSQGPYSYVLCTGDVLRHDFGSAFMVHGRTEKQFQSFGIKTAQFVLGKLQAAFPSPVIFALGNNDTVYGDYTVPPSNPLLRVLSSTIKTVASNPGQQGTFRFGGYYSFPDPTTPNHDFLALNSVFWSRSYVPSPPPRKGPIIDPAASEMAWLTQQLTNARQAGRKVSLLMHVPPGMDAYSSSNHGAASLMWNPKYAEMFNATVLKFKDVLTTSFAGHTHMEDFRVMTDPAENPLMVIHNTPAVTPDFNNNPAFSVYTFDPATGSISDFQTFFAQLSTPNPIWQREFRFSTTYGATSYDGSNLLQIVSMIRQQGKVYDAYSNLYDVSAAPSPINSSNWMYYTCAQTEFTADDFNECVESLK